MKKDPVLYFNAGFTEKLIPQGFKENFSKKIKRGKLLITKIKIYENNKKIIEEEHKHRIILKNLFQNYLKI